MKIILDPGHGQYGNRYPANPAYYEGTQMYLLANYLKAELEAYSGVEVILTRTRLQDDPALSSRGNMAKGAGAFLSLHSNAIGSIGTTAVKGVEIYYTMANPVPNKALADKLMDTISKTMNTPKRFAVTKGMPDDPKRDYFQVVRSAAAVGCPIAMLVEHGYHTNPDDTAYLVNADNLRTLAKAEAETIAAHFGLRKKKKEDEEMIKISLEPRNHKAGFCVTAGIWRTPHEAQVVKDIFAPICDTVEIAEVKDMKGNKKYEVWLGKFVGAIKEVNAFRDLVNASCVAKIEIWSF